MNKETDAFVYCPHCDAKMARASKSQGELQNDVYGHCSTCGMPISICADGSISANGYVRRTLIEPNSREELAKCLPIPHEWAMGVPTRRKPWWQFWK